MDERQILSAILRQDFKSFVRKVFDDVSSDDYRPNWHIDLICNEIMGMINGQNNKLIINIPPRNMKSIICSVALPAFLLGHSPETRIICVSYNDSLADKFASDCRRVMSQRWYQDLFPRTIIANNRRAISDFETTRGGGRMSTSIGGTLTGRGADWIIIDDPLKPSDAFSDTQREKVNEWYGSTLCTRLNNKNTGKIILIMQRLHENDLTGFLIESGAGFKLLRLPAIADSTETWKYTNPVTGQQITHTRNIGELLHPERENMDVMCEIRHTQGEIVFASQYQQLPAPADGNLIKAEWLHYYNELPFDFNELIIACDTAAKPGQNNAYSAFVILGVHRTTKTIYLLEVIRERLTFPELTKRAQEIYTMACTKYKTCGGAQFVIEDASSGTQLIQFLRVIPKFYGRVKGIPADCDKITRFNGITPYIENGTLLFPSTAGSWWPDFYQELTRFPSTTFKDQCDALAHGVHFAWNLARTGPIRAIIIG